MSRVLIPILIFIGAIGLFFSYVMPSWSTLWQYKALEDRLEGAYHDLASFDETKARVTQSYTALQKSDVERLARIMPDSIDPVKTIIDVNNLVRAHNLTMTSFTFPDSSNEAVSVESDEGEIDSVKPEAKQIGENFLIILSGNYEDFKLFLEELESSLMVADVTGLTVQTSESKEGAAESRTYQVAFTIYRLQ